MDDYGINERSLVKAIAEGDGISKHLLGVLRRMLDESEQAQELMNTMPQTLQKKYNASIDDQDVRRTLIYACSWIGYNVLMEKVLEWKRESDGETSLGQDGR